ncbi:ParB/RepB/Spo0J family partition protein [Calidifontibacter sp. DB0510]|uniref:ParB/RepB/Spo0J family partition protein n=1 Tax=Metallococcus carri TaxID=1656884 RepID=A0A967E9B9_9MICO|nr:ParB/RepB/Spo0J family partition protein [Metallococcus carri]NHN56207.1 ParB/RepB/Spo0J family partition protein [Metallococcus carri]NOP38742.1 ParB/RepB/Spo0J family partition protein [Calidifontibacter sp. DB2511S]
MSDKRRGLGRGLGALIPTTAEGAPATARPSDVFFPGASRTAGEGFTGNASAAEDARPAESTGELQAVPGAAFAEIPVEQIRPNPRQPRTVFDEDDLAELTHSIREIGVLQPVVVRPLPDADGEARYELIMGERRLRASKAAERDTIPAIVRSTSDDDLLRDALLENLHRSQLNPLEEAAAYRQLLDDFDCTHEELATRIGRSRPQISNMLRLLKLPPLVARRVAAGVLSAGHARALLGLPDAAAQERLAQRIVAEGLSVRTTEEIVSLGEKEKPQRHSAPRERSEELDDLGARLSDRLDTRVNVSQGRSKGKVVIEYAGADDLHRILDVLGLS